MNIKKAFTIIVLIVAILLIVGSAVVRCTTNKNTDEQTQQQEQQEQSSDNTDASTSDTDNTDTSQQGGIEKVANLKGTSWIAQDNSGWKLNIVDGAFVEINNKNKQSVVYFSVEEESFNSNELQATLLCSVSADKQGAQRALVVNTENASKITLECDALQKTYALTQTQTKEIKIGEGSDKVAKYLAITKDELEKQIKERAASISPSATKFEWSGQVWIDYINDVISTSGTLNDGAATQITITKNNGEIEVL